MIDTLGSEDEEFITALYPLLSKTRTAPLSSDRFCIVTVMFVFAWAIAATLRLIIMLPCATTFANTTLVHDVLIVSFASGIVQFVATHGITASVCCTVRITTVFTKEEN